jgi:hypothetical protein
MYPGLGAEEFYNLGKAIINNSKNKHKNICSLWPKNPKRGNSSGS